MTAGGLAVSWAGCPTGLPRVVRLLALALTWRARHRSPGRSTNRRDHEALADDNEALTACLPDPLFGYAPSEICEVLEIPCRLTTGRILADGDELWLLAEAATSTAFRSSLGRYPLGQP